ncbi:hypothetical protein ACR3K2_09590 [Cryptosporidium serpentis]
MLNGNFVLQNNQNVSLNFGANSVEGVNAKDVDPGSNGFQLKIEKSPILIAYDLTYMATLYHDFEEDIKLFSYTQVNYNPTGFCYDDIRNCQKVRDQYLYGTPNLPPGQTNWNKDLPVPPGSQGVCCWCPELYITLNTNAPYSRATLHCTWIQQRLWWNVYLSKSCPVWIPPWWTALRVGGWNWQYSLNASLSWFSPTNSSVEELSSSSSVTKEQECIKKNEQTNVDCGRLRHNYSGTQISMHILNSSSPSFYDPNFGATIQVVSSGPPFGSANAKDLNGFVMLQPTYVPPGMPPSFEIPTLNNYCSSKSIKCNESDIYCNPNNCLKPTLILPPDTVDFTGVSCNKIASSIYTWSSVNGRFCYHPPSTCQNVQIADYYKKLIKDQSSGKISEFSVEAQNSGEPQLIITPSNYNSSNMISDDDNSTLQFYLGYVFDSIFDTEIMFSVEASSVSWVASAAPGIITYIEPPPIESCFAMGYTGCPIKIYVRNSGTFESGFVVQIPYCTKNSKPTNEVNPIMAQSRSIKAQSTGVFTFIIGVSVTSGSKYECTAVLYNSFSIHLDQHIFTFSTQSSPIALAGSRAVIGQALVNITSLTNEKYPSIFTTNPCLACKSNFWCIIANFGACVKLGLKLAGIVLASIIGCLVLFKIIGCLISIYGASNKIRIQKNSNLKSDNWEYYDEAPVYQPRVLNYKSRRPKKYIMYK